MVNFNVLLLNSNQGIFYSGQPIIGEVQLQTDSAIDVNSIKLVIKGNAEVTHWSHSEYVRGYGRDSQGRSTGRNQSFDIRGREDYLNIETLLFGGHGKQELPPGVHKFNFESPLPPNVPSSFEHGVGKIRYRVKAILDRPWKMNQDKKVEFTVVNVIDLNIIQPSLLIPQRVTMSKTFCCGLASAVSFSVEVPVSGFVCGQEAHMTINANNESSITVSEIRIELKQVLKFFGVSEYDGGMRTSDHTKMMSRNVFPGVKARKKKSFQVAIPIVNVQPSNMGTSGVIWIAYEIHICAKVGWFHRSPRLQFPIVIGNVPLAIPQDMQQEMEAQNYPAQVPLPSDPMMGYPGQFGDGNVPYVPTAPNDDLPPSFDKVVGVQQMPMNNQAPSSFSEKQQPNADKVGWAM